MAKSLIPLTLLVLLIPPTLLASSLLTLQPVPASGHSHHVPCGKKPPNPKPHCSPSLSTPPSSSPTWPSSIPTSTPTPASTPTPRPTHTPPPTHTPTPPLTPTPPPTPTPTPTHAPTPTPTPPPAPTPTPTSQSSTSDNYKPQAWWWTLYVTILREIHHAHSRQ